MSFFKNKPIRISFALAAILIICGSLISLIRAQRVSNPAPGFRPTRLLDPQPTITNNDVEIKTVEQVGNDLKPNELVIGVEVAGQFRAYPINMLTGPRREIVNDQLGDRAIATTW